MAIASLGVHSIALALLGAAPLALALVAAHRGTPAELAAAAPEPAALDPSCDANVALSFAARMLYCAGPFSGDSDACAQAALKQLDVGQLACHAVVLGDNPVEVALLDPAKIDEIEAEPLIETLDPIEQQKFEVAQEQKREQMAEQLQKQESRPDPSAQVIEMAKPQVEVAPEESRFLSEYDNKVAKQTVARGSRFEEIIAKPQPAELAPKPDPRENSVQELRPDLPAGARPDAPPLPGVLRMRPPGASGAFQAAEAPRTAGAVDGAKGPPNENGIAPRKGEGAFATQGHDPVESPRGQGGAGGGQAPVPDLKPSQDVLERIAGGGSVDHLDDVDEGDETALSSKRWKFAGFFNRLKRQVSQNWDPASVYQRRDPSGRVYGTRTRVTQVRVSLDPSGNLESIYVVKGSGVDFLDEEAVRAFRAAQPFPNPPAGLLGGDKVITFVFGFYFEIGERPVWKIYRAQ